MLKQQSNQDLHLGPLFGECTQNGLRSCDHVLKVTMVSAKPALSCKLICTPSTSLPNKSLRKLMLGECIYSTNTWIGKSIGLCAMQSKIKGSNILTIIIDSMDKKKTVWPKWAFDRPSKEIEKLGARPRVVITAALAHGYTTSWFFGS